MASITIIGGTGLVGKEVFRMGAKAGLRLTSVTSTGALYGSNPWYGNSFNSKIGYNRINGGKIK